jgi:hypothetical protein
MFTNEDRGGFAYTFAHWCAFNMTALNLGVWKVKYLFHDVEKPFLMIWFRGDYTKTRNWHKEHNRHHLRYKGRRGIDWETMVIDWECSRFTKIDKPWNARETMYREVNYPRMNSWA